MKKLQIVLVLIAFQLYLHVNASQDLCADARESNRIFADDPSHQSRYLYCDQNTKVTYQLTCDNEDFTIFYEDGCWREKDVNMSDIIICPQLNKPIKYATDECISYAICMGDGSLGAGSCTDGLNFDRNSGVCVVPNLAPCSSSSSGDVDCSGDNEKKYTLVPNTGCRYYAFCYNGAEVQRWPCPEGQLFDVKTRNCDKDATCAETSKQIFENVPSYIPRAKNMWK
ncbi:hypothetical protein PVAND_015588 [Polypedilum vanderplanki]|uniref:Chitin-binding type-2 domain-containing protein n=1 Tax=Polypedilum vanderplanki TaxID=319348 RepID=A0A9J6BDJ9_POLVA|nr:hypothetical protein PVAND_015588 [Polypedilum vanderplanki]